jgi:hypothetical protein
MSARWSYRHYAYVASALIGALALWTLVHYPGRWWVYAVFTLAGNALLYLGFRRDAIFFDAFIGVFFWLGFWLKLSVRVAFFDGQFNEPVGRFDGSGAAFDRALLVSSCGLAGLLAARLLRPFLFTYPATISPPAHDAFLAFYARHRRAVLLAFVGFVLAIGVSNLYLGVYQRGAVPKTVLPYGMSGIYTWLLLFGLASFCAVIVHQELRLNKHTTYAAVGVSLMEGFCSNVSLLSRGMVLNTGALGYGVLRALKPDGIRTSVRFWAISLLAFAVLFAGSVLLVNYLRNQLLDPSLDLEEATRMTRGLFLDRWVGMEGVMAVSSHPELGWGLWREAWAEVYQPKLSLYDSRFITSAYVNTDFSKHHFISLPGIVAFFFYPGSFILLLVCMFVAGTLAAAVEVSVFKIGGANLVLCALLAQVVASRYVHFGYVPRQTYLLFGALYLTLFLIYLADKALAYRNRRSLR